ncbi:golgin subfamily A member 6-like protein 22 [Anoplopoma fimbria]|uniref:golgin subfamily A member 6-like protein 22 n=1 Tax=Anoplopoma fimbria TaxID=229290 RepID=UPI0023EB5558|nr:golgin subfamily A member 6-like protein 22 [Anoplopoma fimbria]
MESPLSRKQRRHLKRKTQVQQQETKLEDMELNSKVVEPPINFYLSSLEEQVRSELKDSEARLTKTESEGRVLLDIDEDSLQHFLDHVQEKNVNNKWSDEKQETPKEVCGLKDQLHESQAKHGQSHVKLEQVKGEKEALQNEVEAKKMELCAVRKMIAVAKTNVELELESYLEIETAQTQKLRIELRKMAEALKNQAFHQAQMNEARDLLETERLRPHQKATTEEEMETFRDFCQAKVDEQIDISSKLKAALDKTEQQLKTVHLQWQQEKFFLTTQQQKNGDYLQSQVHLIASFRAQEQEALKQTLERSQAFHQAQMNEQTAETNRIAAALKEAQDLLETERLHSHQKTITQEEMEIYKTFCQAKFDEHVDINGKFKAALHKAEQELKNGHLQWQKEKSSLTAQLVEAQAETRKTAEALKEAKDLLETERLHSQQKTTTQEEMETSRASCLAELDEHKKDISKLKAALEKAEQELKTGTLQWEEEKSSLIAQLETDWDNNNDQLKTIASLQTQEEEAKQTLERFQSAHQAQLEEQRAENSKILEDLKKTEDLLKTEHLRFQEQSTLTAQLETSQSNYLAQLEMQDKDSKNLMATLQKKSEEQLESERLLWQQEKASLLKDTLRKKASSGVQLEHQKKKNNNLLAAVMKTEQQLKSRSIEWQQEKSSLTAKQEKTCRDLYDAQLIVASLQKQEEEATQMLETSQTSHQSQLQEQRVETNRIAADLKKTEDLLVTERLRFQEQSTLTAQLETSQRNYLAQLEMQDKDNKNFMATLKNKFEDQLEREHLLWQQEKSSFGVQLDHQEKKNNDLLAAVMEAEQQMKSRTIEWQQEKLSLLQATENIQQTLQEKEQERQTTESSLKSQLEDLQSQITIKQMRKKWYKKLFSCQAQH